MSIVPANALSGLTVARDFLPARVSSWDKTGRNRDAWPIEPGETKVLADIEGPGVICLLYTSPSPRDRNRSRMPSYA